jgi:hypothetical protein
LPGLTFNSPGTGFSLCACADAASAKDKTKTSALQKEDFLIMTYHHNALTVRVSFHDLRFLAFEVFRFLFRISVKALCEKNIPLRRR